MSLILSTTGSQPLLDLLLSVSIVVSCNVTGLRVSALSSLTLSSSSLEKLSLLSSASPVGNVKLVDSRRKVERSEMRRDKLLVASVLGRATNGGEA